MIFIKKILCLFFLSIFFSGSYAVLHAQSIRVHTYAGITFDHRVNTFLDNTNFYRGRVNGGFQWGIGAENMLNDLNGLELSYFRQVTNAPLTYYSNGLKETNFNVELNYIMIGVNRYFLPTNPKLELYGSTMLGACVANFINPDTQLGRNHTRLAIGVKGGMNYFLTERIGFKTQASLLSVVEGIGGGIFVGTGGSGGALSTYSTLFQFTLSTGLVFLII